MNGKSKVSVIVPAHNVEKYIGACLESILSQTLKEIEIICVNDGSTDRTEQIIRRYMEQDERISLINQENRFAGVARNEGRKRAKGTYLVFWDADDLFEPDALETMYRKISEDEADICVCDAVRFKSGEDKLYTDIKYLKDKFLPTQVPFSVKTMPEHIFNFTTDVPWNKMYSRKFVEKHSLEFEDRVRANDHYFVLRAFGLAERITLVKKQLIRYRISSGTSLTSNLSASPLCTYEALLHAREDLERDGILKDPKAVRSFANRALSSLVYGMERQTYGEAYTQIYQLLKQEGFKKLFVTDREEDYYYNAAGFEKYRKMMELEPMEYLLHEYDLVSGKYTDQSTKYRSLKEKHTALKEKAAGFRSERDGYKRELEYIKSRKWYRMILFFANLKNRLTGKGMKNS